MVKWQPGPAHTATSTTGLPDRHDSGEVDK